jgi:hypothetical protein
MRAHPRHPDGIRSRSGRDRHRHSGTAGWLCAPGQEAAITHDCPCVTVVGRSLSHADRTSCLGAPVLRAVSSGTWRHDHLTSTTLPAGCTIKPPDAGSRQCPWVTALLKEQLASSTPSGSWPKLTPTGQHAWRDTNRSSGACSNACGRTGSNRSATRSPSLQIRSHPYRHPDPFRSVRDLGRAAAAVHVSPENWKVVRPCGSQRGSRSHTTAGTSAPWCSSPSRASPGDGTAPLPCPDPPPNPTAAGPGDGRVRSKPSSRVHEPCSFTRAGCPAVTGGLDGFRESQILLRRVRGRTPATSARITSAAAPSHCYPSPVWWGRLRRPPRAG